MSSPIRDVSDNRLSAILSVLLALSLVLALGSVTYAVTLSKQGEQFTEFYLLSENNEEIQADNYPEEFVQGKVQSVILGIENHEYETINYTVVVQLERIEGNRVEGHVIERDKLDQFDETLDHEETWRTEHEIRPTMAGENLRLTYLLYQGEPPNEPTKENSYRDLHLWITVEDSDAEEPIEITARD